MKIGRNEPCFCGSGLKYKRCCLLKEESSDNQSVLTPVQHIGGRDDYNPYVFVKTLTGEFYQPVRLYYKIFNKSKIEEAFKSLPFMDYDRVNDRWVWLYIADASKIVFPTAYNRIPKERHPIVIGSFFTKHDDEMVLDVRSIERAIAAIPFFDKHIHRSLAEVTHLAILNRLPSRKEDSVLFNFDKFFNYGELVEINPDYEMGELKEFVSEVADISEKRQKAFEWLKQKLSNTFHEAEKFPIYYYDDGISPISTTLKIHQSAAIARRNGNENVTHEEIFSNLFYGDF